MEPAVAAGLRDTNPALRWSKRARNSRGGVGWKFRREMSSMPPPALVIFRPFVYMLGNGAAAMREPPVFLSFLSLITRTIDGCALNPARLSGLRQGQSRHAFDVRSKAAVMHCILQFYASWATSFQRLRITRSQGSFNAHPQGGTTASRHVSNTIEGRHGHEQTCPDHLIIATYIAEGQIPLLQVVGPEACCISCIWPEIRGPLSRRFPVLVLCDLGLPIQEKLQSQDIVPLRCGVQG